jgi:hypothetical protein
MLWTEDSPPHHGSPPSHHQSHLHPAISVRQKPQTSSGVLTERSREWNLMFAAHSNAGIMGSNPTRGMDVCVFIVFVWSCVGNGLATG